MKFNRLFLLFIIFALAISIVGCGASTPAPTPDPAPLPVPTPEPTADPEPVNETEPVIEPDAVESDTASKPDSKPDTVVPTPKPDVVVPTPTPKPDPVPEPEPDKDAVKIAELVAFATPNLQDRVDDGRITQEYMDEILGQIKSGELNRMQLMMIMAKYL